ncbi:hypothetical protein ACVGOW_17450 [Pseudonocardia saturnea]
MLAVERGERELAAHIKREWLAGRPTATHGGVVGQVWRGGAGRQAPLARIIGFVTVHGLDALLGKRAGVLLARAGRADVIDAAIAVLASDGDRILTSDPDDLVALVRAAGRDVEITPV